MPGCRRAGRGALGVGVEADATHGLRDRVLIRELADRYARAVDRRDFETLAALFTPDARLAIHSGSAPAGAMRADLRGRDAIVDALRSIARFETTTHFVGNQLVELGDHLRAERASAETYALAFHLTRGAGGAQNRVVAVRYRDALVRDAGGWRFAERVLSLDWEMELPATLPDPGDASG